MTKKYTQTMAITNLAMFTVLINQLYETNFIWQTYNVFIFAVGFTTFFNIIKDKQLQNNLEFAGIAFATILIGGTNVIGLQNSILSFINLLGILLAMFIGLLNYTATYQFYETKTQKTEIQSLKIIQEKPQHMIGSEKSNAI